MPANSSHHPSADPGGRVLTINGGSSSVKFALFRAGGSPHEVLRGKLEHVGTATAVLDALDSQGATASLVGIGHRLVHGGPDHTSPALVTPDLLRDLERLKALDPTPAGRTRPDRGVTIMATLEASDPRARNLSVNRAPTNTPLLLPLARRGSLGGSLFDISGSFIRVTISGARATKRQTRLSG